jgi:predicted DNA-binding WGR domain protein
MKNYQVTDWASFQWTKNTRFYRIILHQDLFGDWILTRAWGRIGTKQGGAKEHPTSYERGRELLARLARIRKYRGYAPGN